MLFLKRKISPLIPSSPGGSELPRPSSAESARLPCRWQSGRKDRHIRGSRTRGDCPRPDRDGHHSRERHSTIDPNSRPGETDTSRPRPDSTFAGHAACTSHRIRFRARRCDASSLQRRPRGREPAEQGMARAHGLRTDRYRPVTGHRFGPPIHARPLRCVHSDPIHPTADRELLGPPITTSHRSDVTSTARIGRSTRYGE